MAHELKSVSSLVELDRTSLRERAMEMLRTAVTTREIEPGSRLVESELSAAMSISRGTLREALRQLEHEGLIEVGKRGRLTVRTMTEPELLDLFAVRAALEGLAAASLSTRPDRAVGLTRLQTALRALEAAGGSISETVEADLGFHRLLCALTGNATLARAWETLTGSIRVAILFAGPTAALTNMSVGRHQPLIDAIASGDPDTARSAVDAHMRDAARTLITPT
jgi:DNA-binding GntR family transcriptional regulator